MTDNERLQKLRKTADCLMEKVSAWVEDLEAETAGPQAMRQLCGTLKDLKDLCRDLEEKGPQGFTVTIEGGEESWNS